MTYTREQAFSAALRYLRVDLAYEVTEKDADAAYLLFSFPAPELEQKSANGSIEVVQTERSVRLLVSLPQLPAYREDVLKSGLLQKLRTEYGEPPRREKEKSFAGVQLHVVGSPEDHAHHREGLKRLYGLFRRMKAEDHVALALFMVDGRSLEEVAVITGVSLVAAKNRVSRARRKLFDAARKDQLLLGYLAECGEAG